MGKDIELYMLKPESLEVVIDRLTDFAKKDDVTINAFYFLYGIAKLVDNIKSGEEFYDYLQNKSTEFMYDRTNKMLEYMKQLEKGSPIYEIGKRLMCTFCEGSIGTIFYNNHHREEIVKIFNEELF